jgi:hypothetical protein
MEQVFGLNAFEIVIHHLAPGPEAVLAVTGAFTQARHRALVRMRVQVRNRRQQDFGAIARIIGRIRRNRRDIAIGVDTDFDRLGPAAGQ